MPITNHYRSSAARGYAGRRRPRARRLRWPKPRLRAVRAGRPRRLSDLTSPADGRNCADSVRGRRRVAGRVPPDPGRHGRPRGGVPVDRARPLPPARASGSPTCPSPPSRSTWTPRACATPGTPSCGPSACRCCAGADPDAWTTPSAPTTALFAALSGVAPPRPRRRARRGRRPTRTISGPPGPCPGWPALYRVVLPRLVTSYERHLRVVSPDDRRAGGPGPPAGAQRRGRGLARRRAIGGTPGQPTPRRRRRLRVPRAPRGGGGGGRGRRRAWWPFRGRYQGSDLVEGSSRAETD